MLTSKPIEDVTHQRTYCRKSAYDYSEAFKLISSYTMDQKSNVFDDVVWRALDKDFK